MNGKLCVMVAGASGFLGFSVAQRLIEDGHHVLGLVSSPAGEVPHGMQRIVVERPWSVEAVRSAMSRHPLDGFVHAIGGPRAETAALYGDNVVLQEHVLDALGDVAPGARVLVLGSAAEYGRPKSDGICCEGDVAQPISAYGIAKLAQTRHALLRAERGQDVRVGRIFNPVGARMRSGLVFVDVAERLAAGGDVLHTGYLGAKRDFFPVAEAARILVELLVHPLAAGEVVNVCSGVARPVRDGVDQLVTLTSRRRGAQIKVLSGLRGGGGLDSVVGSTRKLNQLAIAPAAPAIESDLVALFEETSSRKAGRSQ